MVAAGIASAERIVSFEPRTIQPLASGSRWRALQLGRGWSSPAIALSVPVSGSWNRRNQEGNRSIALDFFECGIRVDSNCAACFFGRGIVKRMNGGQAGADADLTKARARFKG